MLPCTYCKKDFMPKHKLNKFCSLRCQRAYRANPNPSEPDLLKISVKLLKLTCPYCHTQFTQTRSNQLYCSPSCRMENHYHTKIKPKRVEAIKSKKNSSLKRWEALSESSQRLWDEIEKGF